MTEEEKKNISNLINVPNLLLLITQCMFKIFEFLPEDGEIHNAYQELNVSIMEFSTLMINYGSKKIEEIQ